MNNVRNALPKPWQRTAFTTAACTFGFAVAAQGYRKLSSVARATNQVTPNLSGRRAIVVGGTAGIGQGIALSLAKAGCSVVIAGRSEERGKAVVQELIKHAASTSGPANFSFEPLNCFSLPACDEFAKRQVHNDKPLDLLVFTQGMATFQGFTPTPEEYGGLDQKLTLHYWSRALIADRLAPKLQHSNDGRVLFVLTPGVHKPYANYEADPELSKGSYSVSAAADAGCFYTDIAVEKLSIEHPKVAFLHSGPGMVASSWGTELPFLIRGVVRFLQLFARSSEECGEIMVQALVSEQYGPGGWHLIDQNGQPTPQKTSLHDIAKDKVWAHTKAVISNLGSVDRKPKAS